MSLSNYDKFFLTGIYAGLFTMGGYIGAVGLSSRFSAAAYGIYGIATAVGAAYGVSIMREKFPTPDALPPKPESDDIFVRHHEKQNPEPLTEAEQSAVFKTFMKDSGKTFAGFFLGAALGLGVGYGAVKTMDHFVPPPVEEQKPPETIKDIRDLGYWNRSDTPKP